MTRREILTTKGSVSHRQAIEKALFSYMETHPLQKWMSRKIG